VINICWYDYKRKEMYKENMSSRYIEMGFTEESSEEATVRFGDDLHAGCHWLMTRETIGQVPKRLKRSSSDRSPTYTGSVVRLSGLTWTITAFDPMHALIRLTRAPLNDKSRWEHISDARLEWIQVRHTGPTVTIPKASWWRSVGYVDVSLAWLDTERLTHATSDNILDMYIRHGRPLEPGTQWTLWRAITTLSREFVHEPTRPKPSGISSDDVHNFKVEWMTYFNALCDACRVEQDTFSDRLYNGSIETVLELFPLRVRTDLKIKLDHWQHPQPHLAKMNACWRKDCLPLVGFKCHRLDKETFTLTFSVEIHNMSFVQPVRYEPGVHLQLQRLFFLLFPKTYSGLRVSGPMDEQYLQNILRCSRKSWQRGSGPGPDFEGTLFPYQKQCLDWMVTRERSDSQQMPTSSWGWSRHELDDGFVFHTSPFGFLSLTPPNNTIRGGLLAQDVGMGKTVEMLALMATHKANGPTLVVVPTTMLTVWQSEAATHTPSFNVVLFHGARRTTDMDVLRTADIVLTTYRIVVNETRQHVASIGAVRWGRIILDESHELRHVHTETTKAICRLRAPLRWCVSATPLPKGMASAAAILSFLGVRPFDEAPGLGKYSAAQLLLRNHREYNPTLLHELFTKMTWWQLKSHVRLNLPPVQSRTVEVDCDHPELYDRLLAVVRFRLELDDALYQRPSRTRIIHYTRWLRQMATHPALNRVADFGMPSATDEVATEYNSVDSFIESLGTSNYEQSLRGIIKSWRDGNETCSICMDVLDRPTLTPCNHMFCFECIQMTYQHDVRHRCPLCRTPSDGLPLKELTEQEVPEELGPKVWRSHDLQGCPIEMEIPMYEQIQEARTKTGSKFNKLLELIDNGEDKCIVFTQFHNAWLKVCECLKKHNVEFVSIEGKMTPKKRSAAIQNFQQCESTKVFVMTTKTASVGITLTAGSHVIFLEPCENKHLRKQAIGRAWRIGQSKTVTVTTLKTSGTIDMIPSNGVLQHIIAAVE